MKNLTQLLLLLQQEIEILRDVALHVFADRCTPAFEYFPCGCLLAICSGFSV